MRMSFVCRLLSCVGVAFLAALPLANGQTTFKLMLSATNPTALPGIVAGEPVKLEKATYLGLATASVPAAEAAQLAKLPPYSGLHVESLDANSPAEKAGLQKWDIIDKLDDQILINPGQLAALVRMHKPGDEVKLSVLRKGEHLDITAKLEEKELPSLEDELQAQQQNLNLQNLLGGGPGIRMLPITGVMDNTGTWADDKHTMTLTFKQGKPQHLIIKEKGKDGKVIFDADVATEDQQDKIPDEFQKPFENLLNTAELPMQLLHMQLQKLPLDKPNDDDH